MLKCHARLLLTYYTTLSDSLYSTKCCWPVILLLSVPVLQQLLDDHLFMSLSTTLSLLVSFVCWCLLMEHPSLSDVSCSLLSANPWESIMWEVWSQNRVLLLVDLWSCLQRTDPCSEWPEHFDNSKCSFYYIMYEKGHRISLS